MNNLTKEYLNIINIDKIKNSIQYEDMLSLANEQKIWEYLNFKYNKPYEHFKDHLSNIKLLNSQHRGQIYKKIKPDKNKDFTVEYLILCEASITFSKSGQFKTTIVIIKSDLLGIIPFAIDDPELEIYNDKYTSLIDKIELPPINKTSLISQSIIDIKEIINHQNYEYFYEYFYNKKQVIKQQFIKYMCNHWKYKENQKLNIYNLNFPLNINVYKSANNDIYENNLYFQIGEITFNTDNITITEYLIIQINTRFLSMPYYINMLDEKQKKSWLRKIDSINITSNIDLTPEQIINRYDLTNVLRY